MRTGAVAVLAVVALGVNAAGAGAATKAKGARRLIHAVSAFETQDTVVLGGTIDTEVTGGKDAGQSVSIPFTGTLDNRTLTGTFSIDLSDASPNLGSLDEVLSNGTAYVKIGSVSPKIADALGGKNWVKLDQDEMRQLGFDSSQSDPRSTLDILRGVSNEVTDLGHDAVHGVDTTHYHAAIDAKKALTRVPSSQRDRFNRVYGHSRTIPTDVWIDGDGLPRKIVETLSGSAAGDSVRTRTTMEFSDYGAPVHVKIPPASDTASYRQFLDAKAQSQTS